MRKRPIDGRNNSTSAIITPATTRPMMRHDRPKLGAGRRVAGTERALTVMSAAMKIRCYLADVIGWRRIGLGGGRSTLHVVEQDMPARQRQIGHEMPSAQHFADRQVGDRRVGMGDQMELGRARPRALDRDLGEIEPDQLGDLGLAIDVGNELQQALQLAQRRLGLSGMARQVLVLVGHGAHGDALAGIVERAGERVAHQLQLRLGGLLGKAPDLAAGSDRRIVVEIHLRDEVAGLALEGAGDGDARFGVVAETRGVGHADPFVVHLVRRVRHQGLGHGGADRVGIAFVDHDHVFAVDEAERRQRIAGAGRGHGGQAEDLGTVHGTLLSRPCPAPPGRSRANNSVAYVPESRFYPAMARLKEFDEDRAVDAAVDCFWARGYAATSVRDLAEAMGIGGASLYNAYGDKRALFARALERYANRSMRDRIARIEARHHSAEAIRAFVAEIIDRSVKDPDGKGCLLVNSALDVAPHDAEIGKLVGGYLDEIRTFFHRNVPKRLDADAVSGHLLGVLLGIRVLARTGAKRRLLESVARPALDLLETRQ